MKQHDKSGKTEYPSLKAGLAETIITPQENLQMRGFARSQVSTGVHDDLHARSIAIEGGDSTSAVMMSLSLCREKYFQKSELKSRKNLPLRKPV